MPITPVSNGLRGYGGLVTHVNGTWFQISLAQSPPSEMDGDVAIQSLVDHLATWPDLDTLQVTKDEDYLSSVTPTP